MANPYSETRTTRRSLEVADPTYTANEFCSAERISRSMLYRMWAEGIGPAYYQLGSQRRITHRARMEFQRQREAATRIKPAA